ncbi:hypothetical protein OF83DRAFT_150491 [Amylostereum chailletii]|nr:hypothetical protein OF83DRAFT_150491 [Amylostereum chailletii]
MQRQLVEHGWEKIKRRFEKRMGAFDELMNDVRGTPVDGGADTPSGRILTNLRSPEHRKLLDTIAQLLLEVTMAFKRSRDSLIAVGLVRADLTILCNEIGPLIDARKNPNDTSNLFAQCSAYLREKSKGWEFDMSRWMAKCVAVVSGFYRVVRVIDTAWLAPFLSQGIRVVAVPWSARPFRLQVTLDSITQAARAANWTTETKATDDSRESTNPESAVSTTSSSEAVSADDVILNKFLHSIGGELGSLLNGIQVTVADQIVECYKEHVDVHCECALLAHLHGRVFVSYIGVSKMLCPLCHLYITAYTKMTKVQVATRGFHCQSIVPWVCPPVLGVDEDGSTRRSVEGKVQEQLLQRLYVHLCKLEADPNTRMLFQYPIAKLTPKAMAELLEECALLKAEMGIDVSRPE